MSAPPFPMPNAYHSSSHEALQGSKQPDLEVSSNDEPMKLPELVELQRQGWIVSAQAAAVVSALLCGVETALLVLIKTPDPNNRPARDPSPSAFRFLLLLSYSALVFNASSTMASLVMLDCLGDIPVRVATASPEERVKMLQKEKGTKGIQLEDFKAGRRWTWARIHCLTSLFAGCGCIFIQVVMYTWLREATSVAT
ncbi:hypothetical protein FRB95_002861, partial [Tulasnella sp. JGI-2019a]